MKFLLVFLILCMELTADEGPNPNEVTIQNIAYSGSGCPAGSVAQSLSPDAKAFTLLFDSYIVEAGPGSSHHSRKNCRIAVSMRFPAGWSFTVFSADFRGYARLDPGARGELRTNYFFDGHGPALKSKMAGPFDDDYQVRDTLIGDVHAWSPCKRLRPLTLDTVMSAQASGKQKALLTIDSVDGEIAHTYRIRWRKCQEGR